MSLKGAFQPIATKKTVGYTNLSNVDSGTQSNGVEIGRHIATESGSLCIYVSTSGVRKACTVTILRNGLVETVLNPTMQISIGFAAESLILSVTTGDIVSVTIGFETIEKMYTKVAFAHL